MVDISSKPVQHRTAKAEGKIFFSAEGFKHLLEKGSSKGSIHQMSEVAGILAAKQTSNLLPLCHPLSISKVKVELKEDLQEKSVKVEALVISDGKTGVEMEALTAVSVSLLTIYDMCKNFEKLLKIGDIKLVYKEKI
jgi:cyclic pyranopterin phosphate synthase